MDEEWELKAQPEEALATCRNSQEEVEVMVKWQGLTEFENSWELVDDLRERFPGFLLEGKESFEGGELIEPLRSMRGKRRGALLGIKTKREKGENN